MKERLRVWWGNWKNRKVAKAYKTITAAMRRDQSYARAWHANIAMPIYDSTRARGLTMAECNDLADRLMRHLFETKRYWDI